MTADAGYAYGKVFGALEQRGITAVIPAKAEPIRSPVPLRRFRYDAKNNIVKCPRGKVLRPTRAAGHGRFFYSRAKECSLAYVSLFSMLIGFVFWYRGLAQGGIAAFGQLQLLQPFFGLALAATLLHEQVSPLMLVVTVGVVACVAGAKKSAK